MNIVWTSRHGPRFTSESVTTDDARRPAGIITSPGVTVARVESPALPPRRRNMLYYGTDCAPMPSRGGSLPAAAQTRHLRLVPSPPGRGPYSPSPGSALSAERSRSRAGVPSQASQADSENTT